MDVECAGRKTDDDLLRDLLKRRNSILGLFAGGTYAMADPRSVLNNCQSDPVANTETYFVQIKLAPESKLISELLSADFCKPCQSKY